MLPDAPADVGRPPSRLVPLRFVPRDSHQPLRAAGQRLTQAALRSDERTQASTKATPATPSSIVGKTTSAGTGRPSRRARIARAASA